MTSELQPMTDNQQAAPTDFIRQLNEWGRDGIPFLFIIDFEMEQPFACRLSEAAGRDIFYSINGVTNISEDQAAAVAPQLQRFPISFLEYEEKFNYVTGRLRYGDSFLTNLTIRTRITTDRSLTQLFRGAKAKYRLLYKDQFLVFSPETFIRVAEGKVYANPMKGTIDASLPNAAEKLLSDKKELAEHVTIVDLLRNDVSQVATNVSVSRFRYLEKVTTSDKDLLQMSSEITGQLPPGFEGHIGDLLGKLLPAGSVSGAPKSRTLAIIREAEQAPRGFYTGVFGYFDGASLDSGVMIRFIEKENGELFYRSGGGITTQSTARSEYEEAIDKIYVPVD